MNKERREGGRGKRGKEGGREREGECVEDRENKKSNLKAASNKN